MSKVSIASLEDATIATVPGVFTGTGEVRAYLDDASDAIHVHLHLLASGRQLRVTPRTSDCALYVWRGSVTAESTSLVAGSSIIVERDASVQIVSAQDDTQLVTFFASAPQAEGARGHAHLMPSERVPRFGDAPDSPLSGGLHADAAGAPCVVWLHENRFGAPSDAAVDPEAGIHSHTEDEVIFVIGGQMRLGSRLCGPGTALAIAAGTMYGFTAGPEGLSFINFRPGLPRDIRFKNGQTMDEVGYWRSRVPSPQPITLSRSLAT